jgi:hypothetical protein
VNAPARFFGTTAPIAYGGPEVPIPLAFRWYDKDRIVRGRRLQDQLRFAVCYWHSLCWPGLDPFGGETFLRPWHHGSDAMALARAKVDIAFEFFRLLDVPFFTFHDVDAAPEGRTLAESVANLKAIADVFEEKMASSKVRDGVVVIRRGEKRAGKPVHDTSPEEVTALITGAKEAPEGYTAFVNKNKKDIDAGKFTLVVADTLKMQLELLRDGYSNALTGQRPFEMGEKAMDILLAIKKGEKVPEIVYTGLDLVTKENVAQLLK